MAAKNLTILAVLLFVSLTATSQTELPITRVGDHTKNLFMITANVGETPCHFIVDTGASMSLFSKGTLGTRVILGEITVASMAGSINAQATFIQFGLGDKKIKLQAYLIDFASVSASAGVRIDGIIGQDILSRFSRVIFDYKKNTITFE